MAPPNYARNLRDEALVVKKALPAANAANQTDALDFGQVKVQSLEAIEFELSIPATPALVDTKVITFTVQDSADGEDFTPVDPLISTTVTATATGGAGKTVRFRLPSHARRFVRINQAVETGGGNNTAVFTTFSALF